MHTTHAQFKKFGNSFQFIGNYYISNFRTILLLKLDRTYIYVGCSVLCQTYYKYEKWSICFILPSLSMPVWVGKIVGGEEESGWQPISATSLQQLFKMWQVWSQ